MGLLDEAIREHLELKRRSGADVDEDALEQSELPAVPGEDPTALETAAHELPVPEADADGGHELARPHLARTGQETQELDMQAARLIIRFGPDAARAASRRGGLAVGWRLSIRSVAVSGAAPAIAGGSGTREGCFLCRARPIVGAGYCRLSRGADGAHVAP